MNASTLLEQCPTNFEDLHHHLSAIPEDELRCVWTLSIIDAYSHEHPHAPLRSFIGCVETVASRLHNLAFEETTIMSRISSLPPDTAPAPIKATPLAAKGEGWAVEADGPPPVRSRGSFDSALLAALVALKPLPFRLRLDDATKTWGSVKTNALIAAAQAMGASSKLKHIKNSANQRIVYIPLDEKA